MRSYLRKTCHKKRAGGVAEMLEHLPSNCDALSSNFSVPQKKKKKKKSDSKKRWQRVRQLMDQGEMLRDY
jgi:hypothetical protein